MAEVSSIPLLDIRQSVSAASWLHWFDSAADHSAAASRANGHHLRVADVFRPTIDCFLNPQLICIGQRLPTGRNTSLEQRQHVRKRFPRRLRHIVRTTEVIPKYDRGSSSSFFWWGFSTSGRSGRRGLSERVTSSTNTGRRFSFANVSNFHPPQTVVLEDLVVLPDCAVINNRSPRPQIAAHHANTDELLILRQIGGIEALR